MRQRALWNLAVLALVALPAWLCLEWLQAAIVPSEPNSSAGFGAPRDAVAMFVLQYAAMVLPLVIGGVLHQFLLRQLPGHRGSRWERFVILVTSPVVGLPLILVTGTPLLLLSSRTALPTAGALVIYGLLAKPLRGPAEQGPGRGRRRLGAAVAVRSGTRQE